MINWLISIHSEHILIECDGGKTNETTAANQRIGKFYREPIRNRKKKNSKQPEKWESAYDQVTIGYSFASDWLVIWVELSTPITEHQAKKKTYVISDYFDTHLKNTLPSLLPSDYLFVSCSL